MSSDFPQTPDERDAAKTDPGAPATRGAPQPAGPTAPGALPPGYTYPVRRDPKSPVAALLLSILFPGLGQVYNGQIMKALVFFGVWVACLYTVIEANPIPWVFIMVFTHLFSFVDAYRSATLINARAAGGAVEEIEDVPDSPLWGAGLLALGVVLLLNNLDWLPLRDLQRFWPVVLILAGAATLWNSLKRRQAREAGGATPSGD